MGISAGLAIPASLLTGYGIKAAGEFIASAGGAFWSGFDLAKRSWLGISVPTFVLLVITSLALATPVRWQVNDPSIVEQVDQPSRDAMSWIRQRTEPDSSFVVLSGARSWFLDRTAEWFPFLTERNSLTTAQGLEWAGPGVFVEKVNETDAYRSLQKVAPDLMGSFLRERYCTADYIAVFLPTAAPARQSLLASAAFQLVFLMKKLLCSAFNRPARTATQLARVQGRGSPITSARCPSNLEADARLVTSEGSISREAMGSRDAEHSTISPAALCKCAHPGSGRPPDNVES